MRLKGLMKKAGAVLLSAAMLCTGVAVLPEFSETGIKAQAASISEKEINDTFSSANTISIGNTVDGFITDGDLNDYFRFTINSSGKVKITLTAYMEWIYMYLYDSNGNELFGSNPKWNSVTERIDTDNEFYLTKGTYYFCLRKDGERTGKYSFKTSFQSSNESFAETGDGSNNNMEKANTVSFNSKYYGMLAINDTKDFSKLTLPSSGRIDIQLEAYMEWIYFTIYDKDGSEVFRVNPKWNGTTNKISESYSLQLIKGTYFAVFERDGDRPGNYNYKLKFTTSNESFLENAITNDNSLDKSNKINFGINYKGQIAINDDKDFYSFDLSSSQRIELSLTAYMKWIYIYIYDNKGNEIYNSNPEWNSTSSTIVFSDRIDLSKGKYYLSIVRDGDRYGNYNFTLNTPASSKPVTLNKTSMSLGKGESFKLTASGGNGGIKWRTSNSKAVTVDQKGNVKAIGTGTAWVTAKGNNGKEKSCKITVKNPPSKISLSKGLVTIGVGEKFSLTSSIPDGSACSKRTYRTSNSSIVKMKRTDWQGDFVGVKPGVAYVTVRSYNGKESTCKVTVKKAPSKVTISKKALTLKVGQTATLSASIPSDAGCAARTFHTSNSSVVKMTKTNWTGSFKAMKKGTAYVTVRTYNGKESSCKVTVI